MKSKKTETPNSALKRGAAVTEQSSLISSESPAISIADFLQAVKEIPLINELFSEGVANVLGVTRTVGTLTPDLSYSVSSRIVFQGRRHRSRFSSSALQRQRVSAC